MTVRPTDRRGLLLPGIPYLLGIAVLLVLAVIAIVPPRPGLPAPGPGATVGLSRLSACSYSTESGSVAADCGTLTVPETRSDPTSELIALPLVRVHATGTTHGTPVFRLGGGPGLTNLDFPQASHFTADRDVVLVGYRGVDGSRRLDCPEVVEVQQSSPDTTAPATLRRTTAAFATCAQRLTAAGVDLTAYSVAQRVDDVEAARAALGYARVDLLSSSAGTRTAMVYSWRHPASIERSAMISVNPPGHFVWDPTITDRQLAQYGDLCRADVVCARRTNDLPQTIREAAATIPDRWGPFTIKNGNVRAISMFGMHHNGPSSAPLTAPTTLDAYLSGSGGDASGYWAMSVLADLFLPTTNVYGEFASFAMIDGPAAQQYYAGGGDPGSILGGAATDFLWGGPDGLASVWPDSPDNAQYETVRQSDTETLLVGGSVDFSTPAQLATDDLLPHLPHGRQVVIHELGHTTDYWEYEAATGTTLLTDFYATGSVSTAAPTTRPVDFTPRTPTMAEIARLVIGVTLGLALLAIGIVGATALRVRRRGGPRPGWGFAARVLLSVVVGLGTWALGVLAVWTAFPAVSIVSPTLVTTAVGVGTGLYTWLITRGTALRATHPRRDLLLAMLGAFAGAALGVHALPGLAVAVVAAAGATACALLLLFVVRHRGRASADRPERSR